MQRSRYNKSTVIRRRLALAASCALHLVLVALLIGFGRNDTQTTVEPTVLRIAIVALPTPGDAAAGDEADNETDNETDELERSANSAEPITMPTNAPVTEPPAVDEVTETGNEQSSEIPEATVAEAQPESPPASLEAAPQAEPMIAEAEPQPEPDAVDDSEIEPGEAEPIELADGARMAETGIPSEDANPNPSPPARQTAPMSERESRVLERRVRSWAESFAALGAWQPDTQWDDRGQTYQATMRQVAAADDTGIERSVVTVTVERDGKQYATEIGMQRLGFAHFAQFIDEWDPSVQIHDDTIDGRFHSNTDIYVSSSGGVHPTFLGKVTTAQDINTHDRLIRKSDVFLGGYETRVRRITMPRPSRRFAEDFGAGERGVVRLSEPTQLTFKPNGTAQVLDVDTGATRELALGDEPRYFIGTEDAAISISGIVDGQVLVYTPEDIVIEGNLVYADDPKLNPASDDFLGLVTDRNIEIAPANVTGDGDLTVQAAIYARWRFAIRNYLNRQDATLNLYGSVTAGSLTATEPRFRTKLEFDPRLEDRRPPGFPVTDRFEITEWDGQWTARPDG